MSRVFDEWYFSLSEEEMRAFESTQAEEAEAGRAEWEAACDAAERARLELEPELPFPPLPPRPLPDCPF